MLYKISIGAKIYDLEWPVSDIQFKVFVALLAYSLQCFST